MKFEKEKVSVRVGDIYKLGMGLRKYSVYGDREFAMMVYKNMHLIEDMVCEVDKVLEPVKKYYEGLEAISRRYGATKENGYRSENPAYMEEVNKYIGSNNFKEEEDKIRVKQQEMMEKEVEIELYVGMMEDMPKEFSAQDIEHFRIIIKDLWI